MFAPAENLSACLQLMQTLVEYRHRPISAQLRTVGEKHSMLHLDVLILLYHFASVSEGPILEIGPYLGGSTIAAGLGARDSGRGAPGRIVSIEPGGRHDHPTLPSTDILADLRKNLAKRGVADLVSVVQGYSFDETTVTTVRQKLGHAGATGTADGKVGLLTLDADGGVERDLGLYGSLLAEGCWLVIDDYFGPHSLGKDALTRQQVDVLVANGQIMPLGLYGWGTWVGRWRGAGGGGV